MRGNVHRYSVSKPLPFYSPIFLPYSAVNETVTKGTEQNDIAHDQVTEYYYYSYIFPDFRAQHCNYATLLAGRSEYYCNYSLIFLSLGGDFSCYAITLLASVQLRMLNGKYILAKHLQACKNIQIHIVNI